MCTGNAWCPALAMGKFATSSSGGTFQCPGRSKLLRRLADERDNSPKASVFGRGAFACALPGHHDLMAISWRKAVRQS